MEKTGDITRLLEKLARNEVDRRPALLNALIPLVYRELKLGKPGASRAVGAANAANVLPLIIPCHRVIGANGTLTGFGGGLATKKWLLDFEGARSGGQGTLF